MPSYLSPWNANLSRRRLLTLAGGTALAAAGGSLLAACSTRPDPAQQAADAAGLKLPNYITSGAVSPDLPPTADGIMAGYYGYPRDLVTAYASPPGAGLGEVTALTNILAAVPPAVGDNAYWQELNRRLGLTLNITMTPQVDYAAKLSTTVAGGDLPDMMLITSTLANRSGILTRLCADLTEFVSGDAIAQYPSLANFPTDSWRTMVYGSGIFAIPIPRAVVGTILFSRADLISQLGLNPSPGSYQEFLELAQGVTDARANRWAFGAVKGVIIFIGNMLSMPNVWAQEGGRFTHEIETEERKRAVSLTAEIYRAGLFHPDALSNAPNVVRDLFGNGTLAFNADGYAAWDLLVNTYRREVGVVPEPGFDGGPGGHRAGATSFGSVAFKKADKDRIQGLLRLADWLAAPLGTEEYMFRKFGIEGTHYTWQDDLPVRTPQGTTEVKLPLEYMTDAPSILGPGPRTRVDNQRSYQEKVIPQVIRNAADGLYSDTAINKAGQLQRIINTAELDIVSGRQSIDYWDEAVAEWRRTGGDEVRRELETAYAQGR